MFNTRLMVLAGLAFFVSPWAHAAVFFNELHYDNAGMDLNEGVEIAAAAGTDLAGYRILLYNGSNGSVYRDVLIKGVISDQQEGFGTLFFALTAIQNGPDAIALVDASGDVLQFLSYEGAFTASEGAAAGLTSVDIGVAELSDTLAGTSLQLAGIGNEAQHFNWIVGNASRGLINEQQSFAAVPLPGALPLFLCALGGLSLSRKQQ